MLKSGDFHVVLWMFFIGIIDGSNVPKCYLFRVFRARKSTPLVLDYRLTFTNSIWIKVFSYLQLVSEHLMCMIVYPEKLSLKKPLLFVLIFAIDDENIMVTMGDIIFVIYSHVSKYIFAFCRSFWKPLSTRL